jgi:hypothetical protein
MRKFLFLASAMAISCVEPIELDAGLNFIDASTPLDSGIMATDSGQEFDAGHQSVDSGVIDGGTIDTGAAALAACKVSSMLSQCAMCHGQAPFAGGADLSSLNALRINSILFPQSSLAERSLIRCSAVNARMPPPPSPAVGGMDLAALSTWISGGMPNCVSQLDAGIADAGLEIHPNKLPQNQLFMCTAQPSHSAIRLRRIGKTEFARNAGGALTLSGTGSILNNTPFDPSSGDLYSTYSSDETIDDTVLDLYLNSVALPGYAWSEPQPSGGVGIRLNRNFAQAPFACIRATAPKPNLACVTAYVQDLLQRGILFREPSPLEVANLVAFAQNALASEYVADGGYQSDAGVTRAQTLVHIASAGFMSTGALFRTEYGLKPDAGRSRLSDSELAQALAYSIGGRGPSAPSGYNVNQGFTTGPEGYFSGFAAAARDGGLSDAGLVDTLFRQYAFGKDVPLSPLARSDLWQDYTGLYATNGYISGTNVPRRDRRGEYYLAEGVQRFFREWLGYEHLATVFKDKPAATSRWDNTNYSAALLLADGGLNYVATYKVAEHAAFAYAVLTKQEIYSNGPSEPLLTEQLDDVIARVVVEDVDVLKNLLTTNQFFLPANAPYASADGGPAPTKLGQLAELLASRFLNSMYEVGQVDVSPQSARWKTVPNRAGVLTHPTWLAAHGGNFEDDPSIVRRGKWVRENLLCEFVPPLSEVRGVVAMVPPSAPNKSARDRIDEATNNANCERCHQLMNPLGYPFEMYNHAGFIRVTDHGRAPNATATLNNLPEAALNVPIVDAVDFSRKLSMSGHVKRCFVRQTFRYFMGRNETLFDACALSSMEQAYDAHQGSFKSMLGALFQSDSFLYREVQP